MPLDARTLGLDGTIDELRRLLVEQFRVAKSPDAIQKDEPLFAAGVGLSSLDGMELLTAIEKRFGVQFTEVEKWIDESPTLASFAEYLIDRS